MRRLGSILTAARYIIILGIIASLALSLTMFGVIVWRTAVVILETPAAIESAKGLKLLVVECTELADLILLAVALYIVGVGLFELFVAPLRLLPDWLMITTLEDLKSTLINIVVVALGVNFLGQALTWNGVVNLLPFGAAIALVIVALAAFAALRLGRSHTPARDEVLDGGDSGAP